MAKYVVKHLQHDGTALGELVPENLEWTITLNSPEDVGYDINMSNPMARFNRTFPWQTDFQLWRDGELLIAGIHTSVEAGNLESNSLKVAGRGWWEYFHHRHFPFDPLNILGYIAIDDLFDHVRALITAVQSLSNSLVLTFGSEVAGTSVDYRIAPGDTGWIAEKVDELSKMEPGFDLEVTPAKLLKLYVDKKGVDNTDFTLEYGKNIIDQRYTNNGPTATHVTGNGVGKESRWSVVQNAANQSIFRRLDATVDFDNVFDPAIVTSMTDAETARQSTPAVEFGCTYIPEVGAPDLPHTVTVGDRIPILGDNGYIFVNDLFRLISIKCVVDPTGFERFELGFDNKDLSQ